ncbi:electron transport complex subunit RsxG [Proteobacteria bacterium 005FR1]|nr:electron transport complex subunit RsxG [Proteobacteria bacterium 005FR1]
MLRQSIGFNSTLLGIFALITAGVVAVTQQLTREPIAEAKERAAQAALYEIIPRERHDNDLLNDVMPLAEDHAHLLGKDAQRGQIHVARSGSEPVAAILPSVAPDGYSGPIEMIVGVDADGRIAGVRVTSHNETPGLGDKIDLRKGNWILSFDGHDLESMRNGGHAASSAPGKGFDQLTGATITRKAVTRQVERTLEYFETARPLETNDE